jgi:hypothetical protein
MEWQRFLEENQIHFVTRGPNTKRGEISIHCPYCGPDDPSEHLGINPTSGYWGCLRDQSHRGKSAKSLVRAILSCSSTQAELVVTQYSHADPDSLEGALEMLTKEKSTDDEKDKKKQRDLRSEFNSFRSINARGSTERFFRYLERRGFDNVHDLVDRYDLRVALTGRYKDRIILPVWMNGELVGWNSRTIGNATNVPRYLASSEEVKTVIYNWDELKKGGSRLFIVEGQFDAIKMDHFATMFRSSDEGIVRFRATCTFGTSFTTAQVALLRELVKRFENSYVLFDTGAEGPALELSTWIGANLAWLPTGIKDPGEMDEGDLKACASSYFRGVIHW